jgi:hypothetical protein
MLVFLAIVRFAIDRLSNARPSLVDLSIIIILLVLLFIVLHTRPVIAHLVILLLVCLSLVYRVSSLYYSSSLANARLPIALLFYTRMFRSQIIAHLFNARLSLFYLLIIIILLVLLLPLYLFDS